MRCVAAGLEALMGPAPGCFAISRAPQQVCRLQLRIDVHTTIHEPLTPLDAQVVPE